MSGRGPARHDGTDAVPRTLDASSDGIDMDVPAIVLDSREVYRGAIFHVDDMTIGLTRNDGGLTRIRRQVLRHAPCVVMLVHDVATDRYLIEREYRAGSDIYAYGLPAGLMDDGETVRQAALRELAEETGVTPADPQAMRIDHVGDYYSSEGMTDELAHIMVIHLDAWTSVPRRFDPDEHVESAWVDWDTLTATRVTASNSIIAIQHETIRRLARNAA
ncbi:NUDIX hydrolase [Bifidobacterium sp. CP2]|uniref:NUDIX hydrolase n=1 Tax=Bifidobacterium sp. CP2 TaxID=2809025 RepID=UPI001BDD2347|nr:NUDIX hydrolase [Bifidobacterium sp. CP2]MBT1180488.1 NUDIX hydrolase [Bifidobacterium sp. CP2]